MYCIATAFCVMPCITNGQDSAFLMSGVFLMAVRDLMILSVNCVYVDRSNF